jgi:secreted trypsin-like serine protease
MRIKTFFVFVVFASLISSTSPALAIQGGESATGSQYVVPVNIQTSSSLYVSCSGAVITARVVATAGHCVLDTSGLISKQILVGEPGSLNKPTTEWSKVSKVLIDDSYTGNTSAGKIGNSDIALLILETPLTNVAKVNFASDVMFTSLKNSLSKVRFFGYGVTTDSGARTEEPRFLDANFTLLTASDPNSSLISSSAGGGCVGDSGAPVLSITPTKVTLIGILTGGNSSNMCGRKESDGKYLAFITNLSRFSNLVATAIAEAGDMAQVESMASIESFETERNDLQTELADTREKLTKELNDLISAIKQSGLKYVKCTKGNSTKTVVGKSPTCPKGFKKA